MYLQYLCKSQNTVNDKGIEYIFNYKDIKDIPDQLANYLLMKQGASFKKANKPEIKKATIIDNPIISYIMYFKKANETVFNLVN